MQQPGDPYRGRRLTRSSVDRMWAGVAGGMAEYFDVDPALIRLIWVAAAIFTGGFAIPVYIALWIIMPRDDQAGRRDLHEGWEEVSSQLQVDARRVADEARRFAHDLRQSSTGEVGTGATAASAPSEGATAVAPEPGPGEAATWKGEVASTPPPPPPMPTYAPPRRRQWREGHRQRTAGLVLVVLGLLFFASETGIFRWVNWHIFWPLVLVGVGVALLLRQRDWER